MRGGILLTVDEGGSIFRYPLIGWCKLNWSRDYSERFRSIFAWILSAKSCATFDYDNGPKHPNCSILIDGIPLGEHVNRIISLLAAFVPQIFGVIEMWRVKLGTDIKRFIGPKSCAVLHHEDGQLATQNLYLIWLLPLGEHVNTIQRSLETQDRAPVITQNQLTEPENKQMSPINSRLRSDKQTTIR